MVMQINVTNVNRLLKRVGCKGAGFLPINSLLAVTVLARGGQGGEEPWPGEARGARNPGQGRPGGRGTLQILPKNGANSPLDEWVAAMNGLKPTKNIFILNFNLINPRASS